MNSTDLDRLKIDVMIIGVEKAGTSLLLNCLGAHPRVAIPGKFNSTNNKAEFDPEFTAFLPEVNLSDRMFCQYFKEEFGEIPENVDIIVGKNVGIIFEESACSRLKSHNEKIKVVIALRNPIHRAYSSFWYQKYRGAESAPSFNEAITREKSLYGEQDRHLCYIEKGMYYNQVVRCFDVFGKDNVKVVIYEDIKNNKEYVLKSIFDHVGLDAIYQSSDKVVNASKQSRFPFLAKLLYGENIIKHAFRIAFPVSFRKKIYVLIRRVNSKPAAHPPISNEDFQILSSFYLDDVAKLSRLLSIDLNEKWGIKGS